jgi:hypothetical protein
MTLIWKAMLTFAVENQEATPNPNDLIAEDMSNCSSREEHLRGNKVVCTPVGDIVRGRRLEFQCFDFKFLMRVSVL